jgi:tRNA pseudouridine38-40 synthase
MRNIRLDVEYDGSRYHGWQYQPNAKTIQEVIEEATDKITSQRSRIIGAGRTDAGVHAHGQVANFYTESTLDVHSFQRALNSLLPSDIVIKRVMDVPLSFHARRDALKKRYEYWILNSPIPSAFYHRYCWGIRFPLDAEKMKAASQSLLGEHDFSSFRASDCECGTSAIRTISHIDIEAFPSDMVRFGFEANGFLKSMVRTLVGTLVEVGRGRIKETEIVSILQAKDRKRASMTAPAHALFLEWILYPTEFGDGNSLSHG